MKGLAGNGGPFSLMDTVIAPSIRHPDRQPGGGLIVQASH